MAKLSKSNQKMKFNDKKKFAGRTLSNLWTNATIEVKNFVSEKSSYIQT